MGGISRGTTFIWQWRSRRIVALSPHAFNAFKNNYPALKGGFDVVHYTQLLRDLPRAGRITPLRELKGVDVIEMPRSQKGLDGALAVRDVSEILLQCCSR